MAKVVAALIRSSFLLVGKSGINASWSARKDGDDGEEQGALDEREFHNVANWKGAGVVLSGRGFYLFLLTCTSAYGPNWMVLMWNHMKR